MGDDLGEVIGVGGVACCPRKRIMAFSTIAILEQEAGECTAVIVYDFNAFDAGEGEGFDPRPTEQRFGDGQGMGRALEIQLYRASVP